MWEWTQCGPVCPIPSGSETHDLGCRCTGGPHGEWRDVFPHILTGIWVSCSMFKTNHSLPLSFLVFLHPFILILSPRSHPFLQFKIKCTVPNLQTEIIHTHLNRLHLKRNGNILREACFSDNSLLEGLRPGHQLFTDK